MTNANPPKLPSELAVDLMKQIDPTHFGRQVMDPAVRANVIAAFAPLDQLQAEAIAEALKAGVDVAAPAAPADQGGLLAQLATMLGAQVPGEVEEFAAGDSVMLRGGGPVMTIDYDEDDNFACVWIDHAGDKHGAFFSAAALMKMGRR